jgi:hypothetical protein
MTGGRQLVLPFVDPRTASFLADLARAGDAMLVVRGNCMKPMLEDGVSVRVKSRRFYLPGDVLVFRTSSNALAAHRVLGWRPAGFITKGDHCFEHDGPVSRAKVVGAVDLPVTPRQRLQALIALCALVISRLRH